MAEEKRQEQQVVEEIVEEEYVEDPHRWTFLKYVKGIAKFKWWVIGFSLAGVLGGYLGFKFVLNPITKKLSASYTYNLAGEFTDKDTMVFIDGTLFNPYELASRENLQKVKDSDAKFASINLEKIISDNAIIISKSATLLKEKDTKEKLTFIEVLVTKGARKDLGRPKSTPVENKIALMNFLEK